MRALVFLVILFSVSAQADNEAYKNFSGIYEGELNEEQLQDPQTINDFVSHLGLLQETAEGEDSLMWNASYAAGPDSDYYRRGRRGHRDWHHRRPRRPIRRHHPRRPRGRYYRPVPRFNGTTCFSTNGYYTFWGQAWDAYTAQGYAMQACRANTGYYGYCQPLNCQLNYF